MEELISIFLRIKLWKPLSVTTLFFDFATFGSSCRHYSLIETPLPLQDLFPLLSIPTINTFFLQKFAQEILKSQNPEYNRFSSTYLKFFPKHSAVFNGLRIGWMTRCGAWWPCLVRHAPFSFILLAAMLERTREGFTRWFCRLADPISHKISLASGEPWLWIRTAHTAINHGTSMNVWIRWILSFWTHQNECTTENC